MFWEIYLDVGGEWKTFCIIISLLYLLFNEIQKIIKSNWIVADVLKFS